MFDSLQRTASCISTNSARTHTPKTGNFRTADLFSNFHLFPKLKDCLGGKQFVIDEELKQAVKARLKMFAVEEYNMVIEKLVATEHC